MMLLLVNNRKIMGAHANGPFFNAIAIVATVVLIALNAFMVLQAIGIVH
jgi:Mn2+/Fe2+ NRAMP family transporter